MEIKTILDDPRSIEWICQSWEDAVPWTTVKCYKNCDEIRAYAEPGQMARIPFFAVIKGGEIIARTPAMMVEVGYAVSQEEGGPNGKPTE